VIDDECDGPLAPLLEEQCVIHPVDDLDPDRTGTALPGELASGSALQEAS
jgi:hypothetical protein